jgi:hypothetical protein
MYKCRCQSETRYLEIESRTKLGTNLIFGIMHYLNDLHRSSFICFPEHSPTDMQHVDMWVNIIEHFVSLDRVGIGYVCVTYNLEKENTRPVLIPLK